MADGASRKSVQDIWKELQSATAPRGRLSGLGGISYSVQKAPAQRKAKGPSFIEGLQPASQPSESGDPIMVGLTAVWVALFTWFLGSVLKSTMAGRF